MVRYGREVDRGMGSEDGEEGEYREGGKGVYGRDGLGRER